LKVFKGLLKELEILTPYDTKEEVTFFTSLFQKMMRLFTLPFQSKYFDFSNQQFWEKISGLLNEFTEDPKLRKLNGNRGSKHFIYINRTFFGLYHLLHDLNAKIETDSYQKYI